MIAADAPVTTAACITNAVPGSPSVSVPVTVTGFTSAAAFTLTLKFDTTRVRFVSATTNPTLAGMTVVYTPASGSNIGKLVLSWTSPVNLSLADGSALATLSFSYVSGTGILSWSYTYGSVCQYKRLVGGVMTTLNDTPKYAFYMNGGISNRGAPVTYAPLLPVTATGPLSVPVSVSDFTAIEALTLYLEYDPAFLTYQNAFTKNPAFGSTFTVGTTPGTGGKMLLIIQWYGAATTLANGSLLCTLSFNCIAFTGALTALTWFDNGPSCEYADATSALIDLPSATYYHNGYAAPRPVASFSAASLTPARYETDPLTDLSSGWPTAWSWSFDRPGVVFVNATSAGSQHPQVQFTDGGLYSVTLTASNAWFSDSKTMTGYIRAGTSGLWSGLAGTAWTDPANWDNQLIPDNATEVVIPPSAPFWPVYSGDFTIGTQCSKLTLSGTGSRMTVTGTLTIP